MADIIYEDLPEKFPDELVKELRKMEAAQNPNWIDLFRKMTIEQKLMYSEIKSRQIKTERQANEQPRSQEDLDNQFRSWWIRFVNVDRHPADLTLEDEIDAITDLASTDNTEDFFDYKAKERIRIRRSHLTDGELFRFFWTTESPFSQWHRTSFTATSFLFASDNEKRKLLTDKIPHSELKYSSAEQFMMYQKAMLFLDREIAFEILETDDVRTIKLLGRKVRNFNEDVWRYNRSKIVYEGNKAKFTQNEVLKNSLFTTKGTTLVEAAPNDKIWGIGLPEDDPRASRRKTWMGKNLLGEILTQLRIDLMNEY